MTEHVVPIRVYLNVFVALLVLLVLTVGAGELDIGPWGLLVAMTIAISKALLIIFYFMHVRYSSGLTKVFVVTGFIWLGFLILFTMSDYLTRIVSSPPS